MYTNRCPIFGLKTDARWPLCDSANNVPASRLEFSVGNFLATCISRK